MQNNLSGILSPLLSRSRVKAKPTIQRRELASFLVSLCGFFVGRAVVFTFISPLSLPFLTAYISNGRLFYLTALLLSLGLVTRLSDIFMARYLIAIGLLCGYRFFSRRVTSQNLQKGIWLPAAAAGSILIAGGAAAALYSNSPFLYMVAVLEAILAGMLTFIVKRAHILLTVQRRRAKLLSGEDIIALSILLAGVIAGASDIYVGSVPLRFFLCMYVLFIVAYKGGASMAAAAGMLLGVALHMAGYWDIAMAVVLGLAGMVGGFCQRAGRIVVIVGIAIAGSLVMYGLVRSHLEYSLVYSLIASGLAFMLTPQSFYFNLASAISPMIDSADDYMEKIKEETTRRLDSFSGAFEKLAATFSGLSKPKATLNKNDISQLIDDLAVRACGTCRYQNRCWEENFYHTYQQIFAMLDICAGKGAAALTDMPSAFTKECDNPENLLQELNTIFALYKTNLQWNNRIAESRELVSQQLHGVSKIVKQLSEEIDMSLKFHEGLEEEMIAMLLKQRIEVNSVIVLEDKKGKYQVTVNHKPCYGKKNCEQEIRPVLSDLLKRRMRADCQGCTIKKGVCTARFMEDQRLRMVSGVAHRAKNSRGSSGDSYSFIELKNGSCLLVLSDGMGSGERAKRESAATVGLLEDFIESGFDKELAVRMINSILVLKSSEESFSTLDICSVDLYTGEAEFIKIGAASTFLLRGGKVSVIRASTLPMGMLNEVDLEISTRSLRNDDVVLMVTDGVTDAVSNRYDQEGWLTETLRGCRYANPQDIADYVLSEAERLSDGLPKDDMTVLAARLWERI